jgi:hypothetical protein
MPADKIAQQVTYAVLDVPRQGHDIAASREPRMQPSSITEYTNSLSHELIAGAEWFIDPASGKPISAKGLSIQEHLERWLMDRPHALVPLEVEDEAESVWKSGSLTRQGERYNHFLKFTGSKNAATVMLEEEAARFGTKPGSTIPSTGKISDVKLAGADKSLGGSPNNPFSDSYVKRNGIEAAYAERGKLITSLGVKKATEYAAAAGKSVTGALLPTK